MRACVRAISLETSVAEKEVLGHLLPRNSITDLQTQWKSCLISAPAAQIIEPNGSPVLEEDESTCTQSESGTGSYYK